MAETMNVDNRWIDKAAIACLAWMLIRLVLVVGQGHFVTAFVASDIRHGGTGRSRNRARQTIIFLGRWALSWVRSACALTGRGEGHYRLYLAAG